MKQQVASPPRGAAPVLLFDHLVGAGEQRRRHFQASALFLPFEIQPPEPLSPVCVVIVQFAAGKTEQTVRL